MITTLSILIIVCLALILCATIYIAVRESKRTHETTKEGGLTQHYLEVIYSRLQPEFASVAPSRHSVPHSSKLLLSTVIARINTMVYGHNKEYLTKLVIRRHIDDFMLHKAAVSRSFLRAYYLRVISQLPISSTALSRMDHYKHDSNPMVRFYLLMTKISYSADHTIETIQDYQGQLTALQLEEIALLLRRKFIHAEIAIKMLHSTNTNLILLGITIARLAMFVDARKELLYSLENKDSKVGSAALRSLVYIRYSLADKRVSAYVSAMNMNDRNKFYRLCVGEGYSERAMQQFTEIEPDDNLRESINSMITSRKRRLSSKDSFQLDLKL